MNLNLGCTFASCAMRSNSLMQTMRKPLRIRCRSMNVQRSSNGTAAAGGTVPSTPNKTRRNNFEAHKTGRPSSHHEIQVLRTVEYLKVFNLPKFVIDPRTSSFVYVWDSVLFFALMFTAFVTPFDVAFLNPPDSLWESPLFIFNRVIDIIFIIDLLLQFVLQYQSKPTITEASRWISDRQMIALHYLQGWFALDVISLLPSIADFIQNDRDCLQESTDKTYLAKSLRIIRTLRLIKVLRLTRAGRIIKRRQARVHISYSQQVLIRCFAVLTLTIHWFSCIFVLQTRFSDDQLQTWKGSFRCECCQVVRHARPAMVAAAADAFVRVYPIALIAASCSVHMLALSSRQTALRTPTMTGASPMGIAHTSQACLVISRGLTSARPSMRACAVTTPARCMHRP